MRLWQRYQQPEYTLTPLPPCPTNQDQLKAYFKGWITQKNYDAKFNIFYRHGPCPGLAICRLYSSYPGLSVGSDL